MTAVQREAGEGVVRRHVRLCSTNPKRIMRRRLVSEAGRTRYRVTNNPIMLSRTLPSDRRGQGSLRCTRTVTVKDSRASPVRMPDMGAASL